MESPAKIYIQPNAHDGWFESNPNSDIFIEYINKDAFIKKACEFISKHIESDKYVSADEESYRLGCPYNYFETHAFIEDFKKYMKG